MKDKNSEYISRSNTSTVFCFEGPRGGGKTLGMTWDAIPRMLNGVKVLSNYPIAFHFDWEDGTEPEFYSSEPLNMDAVYAMDQSLENCHICIDELPLWSDSRRSMAVSNRLINGVFTMVRKRRLSFSLSAQQFKWLDSRIKFQVDLLAYCSDLAHNYPYLERGAHIGMQLRDMSGLMSGTPHDVDGRVESGILFGKPFWYAYDSWQTFDIVEAYRRLKVAGGSKVITLGNVEGAYVEGELTGQVKFWLDSMLAEGQTTMPTEVVRQKLMDYGIEKELSVVGRELKQFGVVRKRTRRGDFYIIPHEANVEGA